MIKINIIETIVSSFTLAFKNIPSIFGCALLWLLTFWIPYLNVGTSIAMANLPIALSRGEIINPLSIFSPMYRKKMGDYIIFNFIAYGAIFVAMFYFVIPAIVLMIAWSMAQCIMIEMDKSPLEALRLSNNITYGNKWRIFAINAAVNFAVLIFSLIFFMILVELNLVFLQYLYVIVLVVFYIGIMNSITGLIWKQLKDSEILK